MSSTPQESDYSRSGLGDLTAHPIIREYFFVSPDACVKDEDILPITTAEAIEFFYDFRYSNRKNRHGYHINPRDVIVALAKDRGVGTDYDRLGVTIAANKIGMIVNWGKKLHEELQQYEDTAANTLKEAARKARDAKRETDVAAANLLSTFADNETMLVSAPFSNRIALLGCIEHITSGVRAQHLKYGNRFTSKELLNELIQHVATFDLTEEHVTAPAQDSRVRDRAIKAAKGAFQPRKQRVEALRETLAPFFSHNRLGVTLLELSRRALLDLSTVTASYTRQALERCLRDAFEDAKNDHPGGASRTAAFLALWEANLVSRVGNARMLLDNAARNGLPDTGTMGLLPAFPAIERLFNDLPARPARGQTRQGDTATDGQGSDDDVVVRLRSALDQGRFDLSLRSFQQLEEGLLNEQLCHAWEDMQGPMGRRSLIAHLWRLQETLDLSLSQGLAHVDGTYLSAFVSLFVARCNEQRATNPEYETISDERWKPTLSSALASLLRSTYKVEHERRLGAGSARQLVDAALASSHDDARVAMLYPLPALAAEAALSDAIRPQPTSEHRGLDPVVDAPKRRALKRQLLDVPMLVDLNDVLRWQDVLSTHGELAELCSDATDERQRAILIEDGHGRLYKVPAATSEHQFQEALDAGDGRALVAAVYSDFLRNSSGQAFAFRRRLEAWVKQTADAAIDEDDVQALVSLTGPWASLWQAILEIRPLHPHLSRALKPVFLDPMHAATDIELYPFVVRLVEKDAGRWANLRLLGTHLEIREWSHAPLCGERPPAAPQARDVDQHEPMAIGDSLHPPALPVDDSVGQTPPGASSLEVPAAALTSTSPSVLSVTTSEITGACRNIVDDIYQNFERLNVNGGASAESLHQAAERLSQDIYSSDTHFLMELLQNADDNTYGDGETPQLEFALLGEKGDDVVAALEVRNNETGFAENSVRAVCAIGKSTKAGRTGYTGHKGIGFKAVFVVSPRPEIHSGGYHFAFDRSRPQGLLQPRWMNQELPSSCHAWRTVIRLPMTEKHRVKQVKDQLGKLRPEVLLFLRRIRSLTIRKGLTRKEEPKCMKLLEAGEGHVRLLENDAPARSWYRFSHPINARGFELRNVQMDVSEIAIAFPLDDDVDPRDVCRAYAFLPLRNYNLPFCVNADFDVPASRSDIKLDVEWNRFLLGAIPVAYCRALFSFLGITGEGGHTAGVISEEAYGERLQQAFRIVPHENDGVDFFKGLPRLILQELKKACWLPAEHSADDGGATPLCPVTAPLFSPTSLIAGSAHLPVESPLCPLYDQLLNATVLRQMLGLRRLSLRINMPAQLQQELGIRSYSPRLVIQVIEKACRAQADGAAADELAFFTDAWLADALYLLTRTAGVDISLPGHLPLLPIQGMAERMPMSTKVFWAPPAADTDVARLVATLDLDKACVIDETRLFAGLAPESARAVRQWVEHALDLRPLTPRVIEQSFLLPRLALCYNDVASIEAWGVENYVAASVYILLSPSLREKTKDKLLFLGHGASADKAGKEARGWYVLPGVEHRHARTAWLHYHANDNSGGQNITSAEVYKVLEKLNLTYLGEAYDRACRKLGHEPSKLREGLWRTGVRLLFHDVTELHLIVDALPQLDKSQRRLWNQFIVSNFERHSAEAMPVFADPWQESWVESHAIFGLDGELYRPKDVLCKSLAAWQAVGPNAVYVDLPSDSRVSPEAASVIGFAQPPTTWDGIMDIWRAAEKRDCLCLGRTQVEYALELLLKTAPSADGYEDVDIFLPARGTLSEEEPMPGKLVPAASLILACPAAPALWKRFHSDQPLLGDIYPESLHEQLIRVGVARATSDERLLELLGSCEGVCTPQHASEAAQLWPLVVKALSSGQLGQAQCCTLPIPVQDGAGGLKWAPLSTVLVIVSAEDMRVFNILTADGTKTRMAKGMCDWTQPAWEAVGKALHHHVRTLSNATERSPISEQVFFNHEITPTLFETIGVMEAYLAHKQPVIYAKVVDRAAAAVNTLHLEVCRQLTVEYVSPTDHLWRIRKEENFLLCDKPDQLQLIVTTAAVNKPLDLMTALRRRLVDEEFEDVNKLDLMLKQTFRGLRSRLGTLSDARTVTIPQVVSIIREYLKEEIEEQNDIPLLSDEAARWRRADSLPQQLTSLGHFEEEEEGSKDSSVWKATDDDAGGETGTADGGKGRQGQAALPRAAHPLTESWPPTRPDGDVHPAAVATGAPHSGGNAVVHSLHASDTVVGRHTGDVPADAPLQRSVTMAVEEGREQEQREAAARERVGDQYVQRDEVGAADEAIGVRSPTYQLRNHSGAETASPRGSSDEGRAVSNYGAPAIAVDASNGLAASRGGDRHSNRGAVAFYNAMGSEFVAHPGHLPLNPLSLRPSDLGAATDVWDCRQLEETDRDKRANFGEELAQRYLQKVFPHLQVERSSLDARGRQPYDLIVKGGDGQIHRLIEVKTTQAGANFFSHSTYFPISIGEVAVSLEDIPYDLFLVWVVPHGDDQGVHVMHVQDIDKALATEKSDAFGLSLFVHPQRSTLAQPALS